MQYPIKIGLFQRLNPPSHKATEGLSALSRSRSLRFFVINRMACFTHLPDLAFTF